MYMCIVVGTATVMNSGRKFNTLMHACMVTREREREFIVWDTSLRARECWVCLSVSTPRPNMTGPSAVMTGFQDCDTSCGSCEEDTLTLGACATSIGWNRQNCHKSTSQNHPKLNVPGCVWPDKACRTCGRWRTIALSRGWKPACAFVLNSF